MKISFENLGPLKLGEIELNKFTVFCGENNTGKTYINYLIYNILTQISIFNKKLKIDIKTLFDKGELIINLDNLLDENIEEILKELSQNVKQNMPRVFNTKEEFFTSFLLDIELNIEELKQNIKKIRLNQKISYKKDIVLVEVKKTTESTLELNYLGVDVDANKETLYQILEEYIYKYIYQIIFNKFLGNRVVFPAERSGLSIFYNELMVKRNNLVDAISREGENLDIENQISKYPKPINDYLDFLMNIPNYEKNKSSKEYLELSRSIEEKILRGNYEVENNRIVYKNNENEVFELYTSSSMVKTLLGIVFYLKHNAKQGDFILIDEPELNLHPNNQRKLARIFSEIINSGINIVMTTHSPYIIKEINSLLMLSSEKIQRIETIMKKYNLTELDKLKPEKINPYLIFSNKIKKMDIGLEGISVKTFEDVLDDMNNLSDEIYYSIEGI